MVSFVLLLDKYLEAQQNQDYCISRLFDSALFGPYSHAAAAEMIVHLMHKVRDRAQVPPPITSSDKQTDINPFLLFITPQVHFTSRSSYLLRDSPSIRRIRTLSLSSSTTSIQRSLTSINSSRLGGILCFRSRSSIEYKLFNFYSWYWNWSNSSWLGRC